MPYLHVAFSWTRRREAFGRGRLGGPGSPDGELWVNPPGHRRTDRRRSLPLLPGTLEGEAGLEPWPGFGGIEGNSNNLGAALRRMSADGH